MERGDQSLLGQITMEVTITMDNFYYWLMIIGYAFLLERECWRKLSSVESYTIDLCINSLAPMVGHKN